MRRPPPLRQVFALPCGRVFIGKDRRQLPMGAIILAAGRGEAFIAAVKAHCRLSDGEMLASGSPEREPRRFLEWYEWAFSESGLASRQRQIWVRDYISRRFALPDDAEIERAISAELDRWGSRLWR